ncbi:MAG: hypothetical protein JW741_06140 [Sedimentisphaerales bacterium]|nr:hypothetical protein [Sedimentisphaerales bacterium]
MPDELHCLTDIPFTLDAAALHGQACLEPDSEHAGVFGELLDRARAVGRPKAAYRACAVDAKGADTVVVEGVTFASRALRRNLDKAERVFALLATCGAEMDRAAPRGDFLAEYWWDLFKLHLLGAARRHLAARLAARFALGRTASMSPGSGDVSVWPIEQQAGLFSLLGDAPARLGVTLTPSCLMVPNKSVSALCFPTEIDFRSCQLCRRPDCPSRFAPFDPDLWAAMQHDDGSAGG